MKIKIKGFTRKSFLLWLFGAVFLLLANGYAVAEIIEMAIKEGNEIIRLQEGSVCLMSLKTDNQFKPEWPPEVYALELMNQESGKKINIAVQSRKVGSLLKKGFKDAFTFNKNTSLWEGLVSFQVSPGLYRLTAVRGGCTRSIGIGAAMANFDFPFDIPFQVMEAEYVYLGRIEMINRERKSEDEIPSGDTTITRIPQRQSGFATGTFEVAIMDNFDTDLAKFREKYPPIDNQTVAKRILPSWEKPKKNSPDKEGGIPPTPVDSKN
jgi:hypothetical protein